MTRGLHAHDRLIETEKRKKYDRGVAEDGSSEERVAMTDVDYAPIQSAFSCMIRYNTD